MPTPGRRLQDRHRRPAARARARATCDRTPDPAATEAIVARADARPAVAGPRGRRRARLLLDGLPRRLVRGRPGRVGRGGVRRLRQGLQVLAGHRRDPGRPGRGRVRRTPTSPRCRPQRFAGHDDGADWSPTSLGRGPSMNEHEQHSTREETTMTQPTYQVTDPATGEVGETFPFATDAEVEQALAAAAARSPSGASGPSRSGSRSRRRSASSSPSAPATSRDASPAEMGKSVGEAAGRGRVLRRHLQLLRRQRPRPHRAPAGARQRQRAGGVPRGRHDRRRDAVELPLLPGRPLRGAEPDRRQHDGPQARRELPDLRPGDRRHHARRRRARRRLRQRLRHPRAGRRR